MKKYIFLDIDGVLATGLITNNGSWCIEDEKQQILKDILDKTNAELIISSSWRKNTVEETKQYLTEKGFWFSDKIIGVTIRSYQYFDKTKKIHLSIPRGVEIKQWLDTNVHSNNGKNFKKKCLHIDYNYLILDDDSDMLLEQKDQFFMTNSKEGLMNYHINMIVEKLNTTTEKFD